MGLVGTLTVELFLMPDGSLVVNELAPRVHNSGHWSIEGAVTSQFEQHLRAICGLPLGSVEMRAPAAAMVNLLGEGAPRPAHPTGIYEALRCPTRTSTSTTSDRLRAPEDGPRDGARRDARRGAGAGARGRGHIAWAPAARDPDEPGEPWHETGHRSPLTPLVGVVGGSRSDFPILEKADGAPGHARGAERAARGLGAPQPDHLYRYAETARRAAGSG